MAMGVVDTLFAGPLGAVPLGGLAIGNIAFYAIYVLGGGTLHAMEPMVSQAFGAGRPADAVRALSAGRWLAFLLAVPLTGLLLAVPSGLRAIGYGEELVRVAQSYLVPMMLGLLPALLFTAYRGYLSAVNVTRPIAVGAVAANLLNVLLDWLLVDGKFGAPALGVPGIGWSTTACRLLMLVVLLFAARARFAQDGQRPRWTPEWPRVRRLALMGLPLGGALFAEVGAFGGVGVLMGLLGEVPLAAHQVGLNVTALLFMVPLGLGSGAAVRCGQALGAGDPERVRIAGTTALLNAAAFAVVSGSLLYFGAEAIARAYRLPPEVFDLAVTFLSVGAAFQIADCLQVMGSAVLRGLGETHRPLMYTLLGYGGLAMPFGYVTAFVLGWAPVSLWYGLTIGLATVAILAVRRFYHLVHELQTGVQEGARDAGSAS